MSVQAQPIISTSGSSLTVGELFESLIDRLAGTEPVEDLYSAIRITTDFLAHRLFLNGSQLLRQELTLSFPEGVNTAILPSGILGTIEPPFILHVEGTPGGDNLTPLPHGGRACYAGRTGKPERYEIVRNVLRLFPTPDQAYTVTFEASITPDHPTAPSDVLPFDSIFDYVYREMVILVMLQGGGAVLQADGFLKLTLDALDRNRTNRTVRWRYSF
jgi:hypothetical protein